MIRLLDLDNCIANDEWRIPFIDWTTDEPMARYHKYHSLAPWDELCNIDLLDTQEMLFILTARAELYRPATEEWLARNGVKHILMLMRSNKDHRHSLDLKRSQVEHITSNLGVLVSEITSAFDDRLDVVEMYRSLGIPAEVRCIHNTCAYTNKKG